MTMMTYMSTLTTLKPSSLDIINNKKLPLLHILQNAGI